MDVRGGSASFLEIKMYFTHLHNCLKERVLQLFVLSQEIIQLSELSISETLDHLIFVGRNCLIVVLVISLARKIKLSLGAE